MTVHAASTRRHAVVIGGSMGGLLAARVLADHYDRVTVLERDRLPDGPDARKGTPQARHIHVLLTAGRRALEELFPGLIADLVAAGALDYDAIHDMEWVGPAGPSVRFPSGLRLLGATRDMMDWGVRQRVFADGRVKVRQGVDVTALRLDPSGGRVVGIDLEDRSRSDKIVESLDIDLVVDAGGRGSRTPQWLEAALDGRYRMEHVSELRCSLALWEKYQEVIGELDLAIAQHLQSMRPSSSLPALSPKPRVRGKKPHDPQFDVRTALYFITGVDLTEIEGIDEIHSLTLISELGTNFAKWPSVKHFASWLGLCPNWKQTGGKVKSSRTRLGKNRAAGAFRLAAWSLIRSHSYLGAYLRRQKSRLGAPKAITATAHKLARIVYNLMRFGVAYSRQEEAAYAEQMRARMEKQLHRRAKQLGFALTRIEPTPPAESTE